MSTVKSMNPILTTFMIRPINNWVGTELPLYLCICLMSLTVEKLSFQIQRYIRVDYLILQFFQVFYIRPYCLGVEYQLFIVYRQKIHNRRVITGLTVLKKATQVQLLFCMNFLQSISLLHHIRNWKEPLDLCKIREVCVTDLMIMFQPGEWLH